MAKNNMMLRLSHNMVIVLDRRRINLTLLSMGLASQVDFQPPTERKLSEKWTSVATSWKEVNTVTQDFNEAR